MSRSVFLICITLAVATSGYVLTSAWPKKSRFHPPLLPTEQLAQQETLLRDLEALLMAGVGSKDPEVTEDIARQLGALGPAYAVDITKPDQLETAFLRGTFADQVAAAFFLHQLPKELLARDGYEIRNIEVFYNSILRTKDAFEAKLKTPTWQGVYGKLKDIPPAKMTRLPPFIGDQCDVSARSAMARTFSIDWLRVHFAPAAWSISERAWAATPFTYPRVMKAIEDYAKPEDVEVLKSVYQNGLLNHPLRAAQALARAQRMERTIAVPPGFESLPDTLLTLSTSYGVCVQAMTSPDNASDIMGWIRSTYTEHRLDELRREIRIAGNNSAAFDRIEDLVDGWGEEIELVRTPAGLVLRSAGHDMVQDTGDDLELRVQ